MLIAEGPQAAHERRRGRDVAALAEDRLDEDCRDRLGRDDGRRQVGECPKAGFGRQLLVAVEIPVDLRVGNDVDTRQQRLVSPPVVEVRGRH